VDPPGCAGVFVCGIAGLIISSVAGNNEGVVLTIGGATVVASIVLLAVSSVTASRRIEVFDEAKAERLEHDVQTLVAAGADEQAVRTAGALGDAARPAMMDQEQFGLDGLAALSDGQLAAALATGAGVELVRCRAELWARGARPWEVMDTGDQVGHRFLVDALHATRPDDAVLSEEGADDPRRATATRVWIVDPLDGTNEYGEPRRQDWAVHVALWEAGELTAGAVALPAMEVTFGTDPPPPPPPHSGRAKPRVITSRNRNPYSATIVANALGADAVRLGSAGAKAMAVVTGEADIYVHDGGMYQWDSAAPGGGGRGGRSARQPDRRFAAGVQPSRPVAARLP